MELTIGIIGLIVDVLMLLLAWADHRRRNRKTK